MREPTLRGPLRAPLSRVLFLLIPVVLFLPALYYSLTTPFALVDDYGDWNVDWDAPCAFDRPFAVVPDASPPGFGMAGIREAGDEQAAIVAYLVDDQLHDVDDAPARTWRWQRASAKSDDADAPDDAAWTEVEGAPDSKYTLTGHDRGRFLRAYTHYEKDGGSYAVRTPAIGPIRATCPWADSRQDSSRYRPFWLFYNSLAREVFGPTPWLYHLMRWLVHFGAVFAFAAAFLRFARDEQAEHGTTSRLVRLLPLSVLAYCWIFFPNQPAARLYPQEVNTVFFLGLCTWMMARMLVHGGGRRELRSTLPTCLLFYLGFFGLVWSKEVNVAAALWLLVSYYAMLLIGAMRRQCPRSGRQDGPFTRIVHALKGASRWKAVGGLPLALVFFHTLFRVNAARELGGYGTQPLTPELLAYNAAWIAESLLQIHTSPVIAAGFAILSVLLLVSVIARALRRQFDDELIFVLFLLGQFASLYLIACTSWVHALRYWYFLVPVFTTLMAFSAKFAMEFAVGRRGRLWHGALAKWTVVGFVAFFVCCNYYNFLLQTVVQHSVRHTEAELLDELARLQDRGHYVRVINADRDERATNIVTYFHDFLPRVSGGEYMVHTVPPEETGRTYYTVLRTDKRSRLTEGYPLMAFAHGVAELFQNGLPYRELDAGAHMSSWHIYDSELNPVWESEREEGRTRRIEETSDPVIRSVFDVYYRGDEHYRSDELIYVKEPCDSDDIDKIFFLHVVPVRESDLPHWSRRHGFENLDFAFETHGVRAGGKCLAVRGLPAYAVGRIRTGQYVRGAGRVWEGEAGIDEQDDE